MSAPPKLPEDHWAAARNRWESDPRKGYAWLVVDMALPVTGAAVRNKAMKEGWRKKPEAFPVVARPKSGEPRSCCGCCGNLGRVEKSSGRGGRISQSEILKRLARALEVVEDCARALRETIG